MSADQTVSVSLKFMADDHMLGLSSSQVLLKIKAMIHGTHTAAARLC